MSTITTAYEAALSCASHGKNKITGAEMAAFVLEQSAKPWFEHYMTHPEIVMGLAHGRFGRKGLERRLTEMHAADNMDEYANG